jgi:hypothetical protein
VDALIIGSIDEPSAPAGPARPAKKALAGRKPKQET